MRDGRIIRVDRTYKIRNMMGRLTKRIDARGRLVIPGFNDSHTHFAGIGNLFSSLDLRSARSLDEVRANVVEYVRYLPKDRWILGGNWDNANWAGAEFPSRELLDNVSPQNPILIYKRGGRVAFANKRALELARVNKKTTAPAGGTIEKDSKGEPTGILTGNAILLVSAVAPKFASKQMYGVLQTASNYSASLGVTSVQDMHSDYLAETLRKLREDGNLKTRVYDCTPLFDWKKLSVKQIRSATGDTFVREGCLKSLSFSDKSAANEIAENILGADRAGLQVMIHAIGNAQNRNILDIFERVVNENGRRDRRLRSEHAARVSASEYRRFRPLDVIASMQPHLFGGYEPYRTLLKNKTKIAFGSDASITDFNPLYGIHAAVNRNRDEEKISVHEAIKLYTLGSAYAEFQEKEKGTIEKGKLADVLILSENLFDIPKNRIRNVKVDMTIVDGKIVYDRRNVENVASTFPGSVDQEATAREARMRRALFRAPLRFLQKSSVVDMRLLAVSSR